MIYRHYVRNIIAMIIMLLISLPVTASLIWEGNAEDGTGVFGNLNIENGATITPVDDPEYGKVWKFHKPSGSNRCESSHLPNGLHAQEGDVWYFGWRFRVIMPQNVTTNAVFQWKAYGSNMLQNFPIVLKHISGDFILMYHNPDYQSEYPWEDNTVVNEWITIVLKIKVSCNENTGYVELWYNGEHQTLSNGQTQYPCRTLDADYTDPKWGIYGASSTEMTNYVHGLKIGTEYNDVAPEGPTPLLPDFSRHTDLSFNPESNASFCIFDILGRQVGTIRGNNTTQQWKHLKQKGNGYAQGMYIILRPDNKNIRSQFSVK